MKHLTMTFIVLSVISLSACSGTAIMDPYTIAPGSVQLFKESGKAKVRVGSVTAADPSVETRDIKLRVLTGASPYGSFANYLGEALKQEFIWAGRFSLDAHTVVSAVLIRHVINAAGFSEGEGELTAQVTVMRSELKTFDKEVSAHITWPSGFNGRVAIANARKEYPSLIQEFIRVLFSDPDFIAATK